MKSNGSRLLVVLVVLSLVSGFVFAQEAEPIAFIGHGGFFDQNGKQIEVTPDFVAKAQAFYRNKLLSKLPEAKKNEFVNIEKRLALGMRAEGQARLVVQQRALDWLAANSEAADPQTRGKLKALKHELEWKLDARKERGVYQKRERFQLDPDLDQLLKAIDLGGTTVFLATLNSGQAYINECAANGVPIPPSIGVLDPNGVAGWKTQGFIPTAEQFIVNTPAELRMFTSANGTCIALPRYADATLNTVDLDGVICLSATTSKVCFWDNQMSGTTFSFPSGTQIPIGVSNLVVNPAGQYQAGGFELEGGQGGVCTNCHAGENPYIIHPFADLGGGNLMGFMSGSPTMFGPNRYDPIVAASWPPNDASQAAPYVPVACGACHVKGNAGRFPHLSLDLKSGYCLNVLYQAINRTMPPGNPGGLVGNADIIAFKAWCDSPANSSTADLGDPHLTTTNGIHYDFQAGGEFISLRNSDSRFELQTRQRPVSTTFVPGANPYTGLASCVSLNAAAALRMGTHRVTYQPGAGPDGGSRMELRVDGSLVNLPPQGLNLGGGNRIARAGPTDGLDARSADGTRVIITPEFWASQGYWYLNVDVRDTPAREGTLGPILGSDWLPRAPNGSSFGPKPASIPDRHVLLNKRFADAWRVTNMASLFDYASGTSTTDFTFRDWPPEPGKPCVIPSQKPVEPMPRDRALQLCSVIKDKEVFDNCVFDAVALGDSGVVKAYVRTLQLREGADFAAPGCLLLCPPPRQ
jgi:hypothetical protein